MATNVVNLANRELGAFKVHELEGRDTKGRMVWSCEHLVAKGGCGALTNIPSQVLLIRAPRYCANCRPKNYRRSSNAW